MHYPLPDRPVTARGRLGIWGDVGQPDPHLETAPAERTLPPEGTLALSV
jgi:hypothetical protein